MNKDSSFMNVSQCNALVYDYFCTFVFALEAIHIVLPFIVFEDFHFLN